VSDPDASESDDSEESDEIVPDDTVFAEFTAIKRTKLKFKCEFRNAILHVEGRDFVIKTMSGDIDY